MNLQKKTIYIILVIFCINAFLVFAYYKFYLIEKINNNIVEVSIKYESEISSFIKEIEEASENNIKEICTSITNKYNSFLIIKDENNKIICSNEKSEKNRPFYISSRIIERENGFYTLNYYDTTNTNVSSFLVIRNFILYELVISIIIIIVAFFLTKFNVISPITKLQKELKNYKIGIIPKKRKIKNSFDEIQNNFIELIDKLEEEKIKQNRIIASISHDIKTPLTSIMGYASRLGSAKLSEDVKKNYIKKIYNKSVSLKEIVDEFDDYLSCNISDTLKLKNYNLEEVLKELEKDYKEDLKEKNIDFIIKNYPKNKTITVDILKLKRVFSNIITNSVNHFESKCGIIKVECKNSKNYYEFIISDNAGGVREENINKIFEPLFTTDPSRKISGLGLSICKEIIEIHKGNIYAKNNEIGGLSIYFTINKNINKRTE